MPGNSPGSRLLPPLNGANLSNRSCRWSVHASVRHGSITHRQTVLLAQEPYSITYCKRYEPWGIVSRRLMPWFDVRFRGYGRNKIVFAAALNSSDFSFVVDDGSFVIHRPHEATKGSVAFSSDAKLQVGDPALTPPQASSYRGGTGSRGFRLPYHAFLIEPLGCLVSVELTSVNFAITSYLQI